MGAWHNAAMRRKGLLEDDEAVLLAAVLLMTVIAWFVTRTQAL
jgi:hypothetical protein